MKKLQRFFSVEEEGKLLRKTDKLFIVNFVNNYHDIRAEAIDNNQFER